MSTPAAHDYSGYHQGHANSTGHAHGSHGHDAHGSHASHNHATTSGGVVVGYVLVETLRVSDNYAGTSYALADGWVLGSNPLLHVEVDTPYGAGCKWGSRMERTYNGNPYLECAYTPGSGGATTCHPDARPAEVCAESGVKCPQCGKAICPCPAVSIQPGPVARSKWRVCIRPAPQAQGRLHLL